MGKKNWIYTKCGLSRDPKHRLAIGESVWLFFHMIDLADWETGIIDGWKDEDEAAVMSMPISTLRFQRKKLQEAGYIQAKQGLRSQSIKIMKWINPRDYSGRVINLPEGEAQAEPAEPEPAPPLQGHNPLTPGAEDQGHNPLIPIESGQGNNQGDNPLIPLGSIQGNNHGDNHGDNHGYNHPARQINTLPLDSESLPITITNKRGGGGAGPSFKFSEALEKELEDLGVFRSIWPEISERIQEGWTEEDLLAVIDWMVDTRRDRIGASSGFVTRIREGSKAPGEYYSFRSQGSVDQWLPAQAEPEEIEEEAPEPELEPAPIAEPIPTPILNLWGDLLDLLKTEYSKQSFKTWIQPTEIQSFDGERLKIRCSNHLMRTWLQERVLLSAEILIRERLAQPIKLEFVIEPTLN